MPSQKNGPGRKNAKLRGQGRGFALLTPEQKREIARKGGKTAHRRGNAHQFNAEEARKAGRKGGAKVSQDRAHMARIGAKGARKRHGSDPPADPDAGQKGE